MMETENNIKHILSDFANFLWDFGKLEMKTQIPNFETPEKLVSWYLSIYFKNKTIIENEEIKQTLSILKMLYKDAEDDFKFHISTNAKIIKLSSILFFSSLRHKFHSLRNFH